MRILAVFLILGLTALTGCVDPYPPTLRPDYTILVMPTPGGEMAALPPECPSWATEEADPYDNQPVPQFGCAHARNLALQVERPSELLRGRELGPAGGATAVGSMLRYNTNQTRGLIDTNTSANSAVAITTASTPASGISGDPAAASTAPTSSSSSSAPAATAAGP